MDRNQNCIAIYSRKSRFTGKGESIGNQIDLCREYIQTHYGEIPRENICVYEDEGFSGGNLNRPDFQRMMEAARQRKFRAIIVYRLDRISRNISDFSGLIEELSGLGTAFISIREQFDTNTPMGRAMMYIASVFSQLERETIAERIRDNMHELAKTGRWLGGTTPTGYASEAACNITLDGKSKKVCHLKLIPEEARIIRLIFDLYLEYDSLTATEAELLKRGIKTKNHRDFTRFSIRSILQNPVYMVADEAAYQYMLKEHTDLNSDREDFDGTHGMMVYNRTRQEKGKTVLYLPPCEWIAAVGLHPGIIPGRVWVSVQESLERNKKKSYRKPRTNQALLTGILFCSCGSPMYPKISKSRTAEGTRSYTYVCRRKERSRRALCSSPNVSGNGLDLAVLSQISRLEEDRKLFLSQLYENRVLYTGNKNIYQEQLAGLRKKQKDLVQKIEGLVDSLADLKESPARQQVARRIGHLQQEKEETESQIHELENPASFQAPDPAEAGSLCRRLASFSSIIEEMTVEQKRAALRALVRKVVWDGQQAHIIL